MSDKIKEYYLWIVVISPSIEKDITSLLVNSGLVVASLASTGKICADPNDKSVLMHTLGYHIKNKELFSDQTKDKSENYNLIKNLLDNNNIGYAFLLLSLPTGSTWSNSTIKLDRQVISKVLENSPELTALL